MPGNAQSLPCEKNKNIMGRAQTEDATPWPCFCGTGFDIVGLVNVPVMRRRKSRKSLISIVNTGK